MNISIVGTGYVGLVTGVCLASKGHEVICVDKKSDIIKKINKMICPIYEPKLPEMLEAAVRNKRLIATSDLEFAIKNSEITIIAVGTPFTSGAIDLTYIENCVKEIGSVLEDKEAYHVICIKSTVVPTTTDGIVKKLLEETSQKKAGSFGLAMNPEFLREGCAVDDFMNPDRIVIGAYDDKSYEAMEKIYKNNFETPILKVNLRTAEMIKYTSNSLLAAMISFGNEISNICESIGGIDAIDVFNGLILDKRISIRNKSKLLQPGLVQYLRPGCGFGGSCFPKDVKALVSHSIQNNYNPQMLEAVLKINETQPTRMVKKLEELMGNINGKKIAVLGIAFKADTDDIRESPAIKIIKELLEKGSAVYATDPQAIANAKKELGCIEGLKFVNSYREALYDADAALLVTAWDIYKKIKSRDFIKLMKRAVIIDGRRIYDKKEMEKAEIIYSGIGIDKQEK